MTVMKLVLMTRVLGIILLTSGLALSACSSYRPAPPAFHEAINKPYLLDAGDRVRVPCLTRQTSPTLTQLTRAAISPSR